MTGYKVTDSNMGSCFVSDKKKYYVRYKINEWVYPKAKYGALAVFRTLKDAKKFNIARNSIFKIGKIFKCQYKVSKEKNLFDGISKNILFLPEGTDFASAVMLIKEKK